MIFRSALLLCLCLLNAHLHKAIAQDVGPSNDNSTLPTDRQFVMIMTLTGMPTRLYIEPLTGTAGLNQPNNIYIEGRLVLANSPQDIQDRTGLWIAFINCDPNSYPGPLAAASTINAAVQRNPSAIVLFSTTSTRCKFNPSDGFAYRLLYTTTDASASSNVARALESNGATSETTKIMLASRTSNSSDGGLNKSPTTAVAMIILYSITGVITALFLLIIVVGAIRAHRHPERYGPRHVIGRPRQSRAKGIARAMLETLPIIKFGDKDKSGQAGDVELGPGGETNQNASPRAQHPETPVDGTVSNDLADERSELVKTETADGNIKPEDEARDGTHAENGLACSVCTDDFIKGQDIRVLPCNHKFHPECIDPWLLNVSGTCPLCRVDLRPTATHTSEPVSPISPSDSSTDGQPNTYSFDPTSTIVSISPPTAVAVTSISPSSTSFPENNSSTNRRSRTGLSLYIQNTLNRRRMRDATPEERIEALRSLRTAHHVRESEPEAVTERPRNRLSARLSRAFNSTASPGPPLDAVTTPERVT